MTSDTPKKSKKVKKKRPTVDTKQIEDHLPPVPVFHEVGEGALIFANKLSKNYGQVSGLNDVSLVLNRGIWALVGPNGAGKSTLLKMIVGLIQPSVGELQVLGENPWNNSRVKSKIGYCPEHEAFYADMTGLKYVTHLMRLNGHSKSDARKRALKAIEVVEMERYMNRAIKTYSRGMKQRIKLAQTIVHDPEVLVLDEPLMGTDPLTKKTITDLIQTWAKEGKGIIVSSHILHELESLTENILLINRGTVFAQGNLHQIRNLIDAHPHTIWIETKEPRKLGEALMKLPFVQTYQVFDYPSGINIGSNKPDLVYTELPKIITREKIHVTNISSPDDNLNAVFTYLTAYSGGFYRK
jgi:ABC-2 type transport system ATP-binding protein